MMIQLPDGQTITDPEAIYQYIRDYDEIHLYPGSFNPLHDGHRAIWKSVLAHLPQYATALFEISTHRRDKDDYEDAEFARVLRQFEWNDPVLVTDAATFREKLAALPLAPIQEVVFHIGYDTAQRLIRDEGVDGVESIDATFIVYERYMHSDGDVFTHHRISPVPENMLEGRLLDRSNTHRSSQHIRNGFHST